MILVDDRVGSRELLALFPPGSATPCRMEFGDFAFVGNGFDGDWLIGVERKTVPDMVASMNGRFPGHQLPGLLAAYQRVYLVVEGRFTARRDGVLVSAGLRGYGKPVMYREFVNRLVTYEELAGVRVVITGDEADTVNRICALEHWWRKEWGGHRGHKVTYEFTGSDRVELIRAGLVRRWAQCLPGIGYDKALAAEKAFRSPRELATASVAEWMKVDGIGSIGAEKIVKAIMRKG